MAYIDIGIQRKENKYIWDTHIYLYYMYVYISEL